MPERGGTSDADHRRERGRELVTLRRSLLDRTEKALNGHAGSVTAALISVFGAAAIAIGTTTCHYVSNLEDRERQSEVSAANDRGAILVKLDLVASALTGMKDLVVDNRTRIEKLEEHEMERKK